MVAHTTNYAQIHQHLTFLAISRQDVPSIAATKTDKQKVLKHRRSTPLCKHALHHVQLYIVAIAILRNPKSGSNTYKSESNHRSVI